MKDVEDYRRRLEKPFPLPMEHWVAAGSAVTDRELEADAESFLAFAQAMGVSPPTPGVGQGTA